MSVLHSTTTDRIRVLNDNFRSTFVGGQMFMTADVNALPVDIKDRIRWTLAASGSIVLARAAFDAAIKEWPHERFTLRQGIMLMREHPERPHT